MKRYVRSADSILCMAIPDKDIQRKLVDNSAELQYHLMLLYMYPNHSAVNHWTSEVYSFIHRTDKRKATKRFPSSDFIYKCIFTSHSDTIEDTIPAIVDDYGQTTKSLNVNILVTRISEYCKWLSNELSQRGSVSRSSVVDAINRYMYDT